MSISNGQRATILIADDYPIVADGIQGSLTRWFDIVGIVTELVALDRELFMKSPDVLLLDVSFGKDNSIVLLPRLVRQNARTVIVMLTCHTEPAIADAALRAGALAYVVKQSTSSDLRIAIDEALAGRRYVSPLLTRSGAGGRPVAIGNVELSDRQRAVLGLLRGGYTSRVIAMLLDISSKTVDYHVYRMCDRLGLAGRGQLVRWAEQPFGQQSPCVEKPRLHHRRAQCQSSPSGIATDLNFIGVAIDQTNTSGRSAGRACRVVDQCPSRPR